jgi:hypothetical protein
MKKTFTLMAIEDALANGYRVDVEAGAIFGKTGRPLKLCKPAQGKYPRVTLQAPNMPRRCYSIPAHKVVAYAIFGVDAFAPGIHVRHLNANLYDLRAANLALGTASVNAMDKPPEVRRRIAQIARAALGPAPNRKLTTYQVRKIRTALKAGQAVTQIARDYGVHHSTISRIATSKTYRPPKRKPA